MYTNTRSCPPGFSKLGQLSPDRVPLPAQAAGLALFTSMCQ